MIQVSDEWKENIYDNHTSLKLRAVMTLGSGTIKYLDYEDGSADFISADIKDATSSESSFDVGNFVLNTFEFKLNNSDRRWKNVLLENAEIVPYLGMTLSSGETEWVKRGTFYITDSGKRGSRISLTAYDNTNAFETSFSGVSITYPSTLGEMAQAICDYVGITLATPTFPNSTVTISSSPISSTSVTDYTCRQMISYIAMYAGCFARCNVDGELEIKWYESAGSGTQNYHNVTVYSSIEINESDTEITGVKVIATANQEVSSSGEESTTDESDEYLYGTDDGYLITIQENPLIPYGDAETAAKTIGTQVVGTTFRSTTLKTFFDPSMEAGDTVVTTDEDGEEISFFATNINVSIGSYAEIKCLSTESNTSNSTSVLSYIMGQTADLVNAKFDNFITKNLEAEVANIGFLKADELEAEIAKIGYLTADEIDAVYVKTDELEATIATFGYLTADSATITDLTAEVANINSVLAGNIGTGTLQAVHITSDNVVFDEAVITDAAIADLSASKITSGTIYTSLVTIKTSEDSDGLFITDSLIAMYDDKDQIRLQAGSTDSLTGESNGYNFVIWDADGTQLFNATGITADGIPSETIVNAHVAENAAISGSKLDISSVISSIEDDGSLTVDSAHVQIDDTTLDAWYVSTNDSVSGLSSTTNTLQSELEVVQGQITAKIWESDIYDALGNMAIGTRNYVLKSGGYTEDSDTSSIWTVTSSTITTYMSVSAYDGYMRWICNSAYESTSTSWPVYLKLSDDFDSTVAHIVTVRLRASIAADIYFYARFIGTSGSYTYAGINYDTTADTVTPGEWQDVTFTLAASTTREYEYFGIGLTYFHASAGDYLDIAHVKIETGTVASDWTPAPEDTGSQLTVLTDSYASLTETVSSITSEVGTLTTTVTDNYETLSSQITTIEQDISSISLTVSEVEGVLYTTNLITDGTFDGYTTFGSSYSWYRSNSTYITVSEYDGNPCVQFGRKATSYYIRQTVNLPAGTYKITFKAACEDGYTTTIRTRLGETTSGQTDFDVSATEWATFSAFVTISSAATYFYVYSYATTSAATIAFVTDIEVYDASEYAKTAISAALVLSVETDSDGNPYGAITTNADYVYLKTGQLIVDADYFTLSAAGRITATGGAIGGWTLSDSRIYAMCEDSDDEDYGKYTVLRKPESSSNWVFAAGGTDSTSYAEYPFRVTKDGRVYLRAVKLPQVQAGVTSITPSAANTPTGVAVEFTYKFENAPHVVVSPRSDVPGTIIAGASAADPSTTGVTIYVTRANTTETSISWIAARWYAESRV